MAFLSQCITPRDPVLATSLVLAGIHFVQGLLWLLLIGLLLAACACCCSARRSNGG